MTTISERLDRLVFSRMGRALAAALTGTAAVLVPVECVACGAPDRSLCLPCTERIRRATLHPFPAQDGAEALPPAEPVCSGFPGPAASGPTATGEMPAAPRSGASPGMESMPADGPGPLPVLAAGIYTGGLARTILAYKNRGHTDLAGFLAPVLAGALQEAAAAFAPPACGWELALVPVPGTSGSLRRRGYHPLGLLLQRIRRRGLVPAGCAPASLVAYRRGRRAAELLPPFLRVPAGTARGGAQKGLGRNARRRNVRGSMTAGPPGSLTGRNCLVVDDVLTTGATIAETVRALRAAGASVAGAVVLAATPAPGRNTSPTIAALPGRAAAVAGNPLTGRE